MERTDNGRISLPRAVLTTKKSLPISSCFRRLATNNNVIAQAVILQAYQLIFLYLIINSIRRKINNQSVVNNFKKLFVEFVSKYIILSKYRRASCINYNTSGIVFNCGFKNNHSSSTQVYNAVRRADT